MERAILLADVSGSTTLYRTHGDEAASLLVHDCVAAMQVIAHRHGGEFVRSKGDDVLCLFEDANRAIAAARDIIALGARGEVSLHAGLHWGLVVYRGSELFGDAVNIAARLSSQAKDNELMVSRTCLDRAKLTDASDMRAMGDVTFRGIGMPIGTYALLAETELDEAAGEATQFGGQPTMFNAQWAEQTARTSLRLTWDGGATEVMDGGQVRIGRSAQCELQMPQAWVSRVHSAISVRGGIVEYQDSSSAGTTLAIGDAPPFFVRRQTIALSGSGAIELGNGTDPEAPRILYEVTRAS
ncbi:MAG: adenylate/guanylate cyclase domain-containing protein [Pseudomonadota bacterium]